MCFHLLPVAPQATCQFGMFHHWVSGDGRVFAQFFRTPPGFLLRFPDYADFFIRKTDLYTECRPVPGVPVFTVEHLYLNQVSPLLLGYSGSLVLHGSAVLDRQDDPYAICFVGEAGRGKSTLATSFAVENVPFLSDDSLLISETADAFRILPNQPSVRLWDDSRIALLPAEYEKFPAAHYTTKSRVLAGGRLTHSQQSSVIRAIHILGPGAAKDVEISRISGADTVAELFKFTFMLDIEDRRRVASLFVQLTDLACRVPCFYLDYPRSYEALPRIKKMILAHAAQL